jgi:hypothetical protein
LPPPEQPRPPAPKAEQQPQYYTRPPPPRPETFLEAELSEVKPKPDNSPKGFLTGKADFWAALVLYYIGGIVVLMVIYGAMSEAKIMENLIGGWVIIGLFFLAWHTKNIESEGFRWVMRTILFLCIGGIFGVIKL